MERKREFWQLAWNLHGFCTLLNREKKESNKKIWERKRLCVRERMRD